MTDGVREQRAQARQRRALASKPFEELDEAAGSEDGKSTAMAALRRAALTAAAAALAGALGGAAKALADRRSNAADDAPAEQEHERDQPEDAEPLEGDADQEDDDDEQGEGSSAEPAEPTPDSAQHEREDSDDDRGGEPAAEHEPESGSAADAAAAVKKARRQLKDLLGAEAESVSAVQRSNGKWSVTLEVVEVRRVPESTDVMSSYDVVLADDGDVVSLMRTRRYRRSQVEEQ